MDLSMAGPGATAAAAVGMPQQGMFEVPAGMGFGDPTMQQQHDGRISYDAADAHMVQQAMFQHHQFHQHNMPSALLGRKHAPDRRPLRFWQPFNDWWRSELTRLGRRPTSEEIGEWYMEAADRTWGEIKPTLQETRVHAKCLRSLPLVRDYFRNYRAKKKAKGSDGSGYDGEDTGDGDTEDGTDNGGSSRLRQKPPVAKRARLGATPSNSNPEAVGPSHSHSHAKANNSDPGASAAAGMAAGSYGGLDMLQAYQAQYWDPAQNEEYARQAMLMQQMALYQQLAAAQQLGGDVQYALLAQQQQQAVAASDPAKLDEVTSAAAAALAKSAPESGFEPGSGAAADDEHVDHEPPSASGATQPLPRYPANTDTATSNTTSHPAAAAADTVLPGMAAEEVVSQHRQGVSGSLSRDGTPQHEGGAAGAEAAKAAAGDASAALSPAGQQHQQQPSDAPPSDGQQEQQGHSGSEQREQAGEEQGAQPMEAEGPGAAAGDDKAPAAEAGTGDAAPLAAQAVPVKAEEPGMRQGGDGSVLGHVDQQQPSKPQEKQQQQSAVASKARQQAVELDLGDPTAQPDAAAEAVRALQQLQQPQHASKAVGSQDTPATPAELQAALFSAAAAAAAGQSMASTAPAAPPAAAALGPTAVSPYVPGMSAAAAAALTGGLNLADSPLLGAAVSQEEPHPGAQLPEAAAAALAAAPMAASHPPISGMEHRANTFGVEEAVGGGAMVDVDEAELLNDVEMGGMSHGELVTHIRRVQQELLSKRELLARSFDQLRRTQDRLARRERKLAKEQQKCKQYQSAVATWQAAWQAAALPSLDPAAAQEAPEGGATPAAAADGAEEAPAADTAQAVQQQ